MEVFCKNKIMNRYLALFFSLFIVACQGPSIPKNIIPREKMKRILTDIHYADAYAYQEFRGDSVYKAVSGMYLQILEKHRVDTAKFTRSFRFYVNHPGMLDRMYSEMIDSLNSRESRLRGTPE